MGHYCRICGRSRANEKFSGRGHRDHICKECQRRPRAERDRIERLDELDGFLHQSNISGKNIARLTILVEHADHEVAELAALILDIARVAPRKRRRWINLARKQRLLFDRALAFLGYDYFEDLLAGNGDFQSPLWQILEQSRCMPTWTARPCDCGSDRPYRDCCLERENELAEREGDSC